MILGLQTDEPIQRVMAVLADRGVRLTGAPTGSEMGAVITLEDPDGNPIEISEGAGVSSIIQGIRPASFAAS